MHTYPTKDIKLASCLLSLGIPYRKEDPVTREILEKDGRTFEQITFWFDVQNDEVRAKCSCLVNAFYKFKDSWEYTLDKEHPIYYMIGALLNREIFLNWMRNYAEPMKVIRDGNRYIGISARATQETKDKLKKHL